MTDKRSKFGFLVLFGLAITGVVILVLLGNWQMARKAWKADLIQRIETRLALPAVPFEMALREFQAPALEYRPVLLEGRFLHNEERHYFLPLGSQVGWHVLTPFELKSGGVVFVDRGFVPERFKEQKTRLNGVPQGRVILEGIVRLFETKGSFTPDNQISRNQWYWRDGAGLYQSLPDFKGDRFPVMVDARASAQFGAWPKAGVTRVKFQDKHLGYALTWYGLALTLVGVFCAFVYSRMKR